MLSRDLQIENEKSEKSEKSEMTPLEVASEAAHAEAREVLKGNPQGVHEVDFGDGWSRKYYTFVNRYSDGTTKEFLAWQAHHDGRPMPLHPEEKFLRGCFFALIAMFMAASVLIALGCWGSHTKQRKEAAESRAALNLGFEKIDAVLDLVFLNDAKSAASADAQTHDAAEMAALEADVNAEAIIVGALHPIATIQATEEGER